MKKEFDSSLPIYLQLYFDDRFWHVRLGEEGRQVLAGEGRVDRGLRF